MDIPTIEAIPTAAVSVELDVAARAKSESRGKDNQTDHSKHHDELLPAEPPNIHCNGNEVKITSVVDVCKQVWGSDSHKATSMVFCDLGCGDGRVVLEVCRAFPCCRGLGVDLKCEHVDSADKAAKKQGIENRCQFKVDDAANVNLSEATIVFLQVPAETLASLVRDVFPQSGLLPGTILLSADTPLPGIAAVEHLDLRRPDMGEKYLHAYLWKGASLKELDKPQQAPIVAYQDSTHESVVQCLRGVYKCIDTGFGNDHTDDLDNHLDSGNLQYGEVTYEGMEALYSAIDLGPKDVFYDLGSGVAKLVLYVALRGQVASSVGVEVGHRRHALAEKACERLTQELEERKAESIAEKSISCSKYSVVMGDVRRNCYKDATVVGCSNVCMDAGVQNRMLDNLMKCSAFRRLATIAPMPPHRRLKLVKTVSAACTWAKISSWHIYDVLAPPARTATSLVSKVAEAPGKTPPMRPSASLPNLPGNAQPSKDSKASLPSKVAAEKGKDKETGGSVGMRVLESQASGVSKVAQRLRSTVREAQRATATSSTESSRAKSRSDTMCKIGISTGRKVSRTHDKAAAPCIPLMHIAEQSEGGTTEDVAGSGYNEERVDEQDLVEEDSPSGYKAVPDK